MSVAIAYMKPDMSTQVTDVMLYCSMSQIPALMASDTHIVI
jgi:hypothetical protein